MERIASSKLLVTFLNENLKWSEQTKHSISTIYSCYGVLSTLRKLKNLAPLRVKEQLAKILILLKVGVTTSFSTSSQIASQETAARYER